MTTLGAPAGANDALLQLNSVYTSTAAYPIPVTLESETVEIVGGKGTKVVSVRRGTNGTSRAAHPIGTAVVAGSGGAAQTVSLLGPFHVTYATVGIDGTGGSPTTLGNSGYVDLGAIPDNANVIAAWAEPATSFNGDGAGDQELEVVIQPADDPDNSSSLGIWRTGVSVGPESGYALSSISNPATLGVIARTITGAHLGVTYHNIGGSVGPTVGTADIYALIATPA